jgi:hypothetical protein
MSGIVQRSGSGIVLGIQARAASQQQLDDFPMPFERGIVEQRRAQRRLRVGIGAFFDQQRHQVGLTAQDGLLQAARGGRIGAFDARAASHQKLDQLGVTKA